MQIFFQIKIQNSALKPELSDDSSLQRNLLLIELWTFEDVSTFVSFIKNMLFVLKRIHIKLNSVYLWNCIYVNRVELHFVLAWQQ